MDESTLSLSDLIEVLTEIIQNIRTTDSKNYQQLIDNVDELRQITFKRANKDNNVIDMFNAYEKIISISLKLRQLLASYFIQVAQYNSLDYALYYNGQRFFASTENIAKALSYGGLTVTKQGLMINLKKVTEELQQDLQNDCREAIFSAFSKHYESFAHYVSGMYLQQNKKIIGGVGAEINMGHVAEGHERHLQEHHHNLFILSTNKNITPADLIAYRLEEFKQLTTTEHWHTEPNEVWEHIRQSLGYQRGTVAGDVNSTQVKQARKTDKSANTTLRLSSIANLKLGIKMYSAIFNLDIPAQQVATGIAIYMSDIIDKDARTQLNRYVLPKILKDDFNLDKFFDKYSNIQIKI